MNLNQIKKLAGLISESRLEEGVRITTPMSDELLQSVCEYVINQAAETADRKNGQVDTDGIRDFMSDVLDNVVTQIKEFIKKNQLDVVEDTDD